MLLTLIQELRRVAALGTLALAAGGSASAGWFCDWERPHPRPWYNPSCEPNWGVQETTWRRFPAGGHAAGSYCADGGCMPQSLPVTPGGAFYQEGQVIQMQGVPVRPSSPGHALQPNAVLQQMVIPQPAQAPQGQAPGGATTNPGLAVPVFPAPPLAVPSPNASSEVDPYAIPPNYMPSPNSAPPQHGTSTAPMIAPSPNNGAGGSGVGVPLPLPGSNQNLPRPGSTMSPQLQDGGGNGSSNPIPMPMENLPMPPMPQANHYQSPFNSAGYPGFTNGPAIRNHGYGYPVQTQTHQLPQYGSPPGLSAHPGYAAGTPSVQGTTLRPTSQPRLPVRGVSFQRRDQAEAPKTGSKNPFSIMSRIWKRDN